MIYDYDIQRMHVLVQRLKSQGSEYEAEVLEELIQAAEETDNVYSSEPPEPTN